MGRADHLKIGAYNCICDRCGRKYKNYELREEWTGWMVCDSCYEPRHPQDFLKGHEDNPQVPWTRPDSNIDTNVTTVDGKNLVSNNLRDLNGDEDATLTVGTSNGVQEWGTEFTADRTATLETVGAQSGDRFSIYRTAGGLFDLIIGSIKITAIPSLTIVEYRNGAWDLESYSPSGL